MVPLVFALALCLPAAPATAQDRSETTHDKTATIDFLDVGQGDAILIRSPEGKTALIDAGPSKEIVRLIRERGVKSIDLVVVSHHHADHYGGMDAVIKTYRPRFFLATDSSHTTPHYLKLLRLVRDSGITAIFPTKAARKIELGSVVLTVMPQPPENLEDENDNSIGIRVQHGSCSLLLTGDSQAGERAYWERYVPDLIQNCTVLKLAHHGGRLDASILDLDQVKAQVGRDAGRMVTKAVDDLDKCLSLLESGAISITDDARKDIESFARIIVGMGPQSTLQRGFAIARDNEDKPLTSREAAMNHDSFRVQFRDGRVAVKNTDRSGGDER